MIFKVTLLLLTSTEFLSTDQLKETTERAASLEEKHSSLQQSIKMDKTQELLSTQVTFQLTCLCTHDMCSVGRIK